MKILTAAQLAEADKVTLEKQEITSEELMERAGTLVFNEIHKRLQGAPIPIKIFCGIGNNGGDGLVVGRHLIQHGYEVRTFVVNYSDKRSEDFLSNYEKLKEITNHWPELIKSENGFPEIHTGDFVIDALFGIGLNRPVEGWPASLINLINNSQAFVLSIDMPSGLAPDKIFKDGAVVQAGYTLSFQSPKLSFYLPDTMDYVGDLQVIDIALDREYLGKVDSNIFLIGKEEAQSLYRSRKINSHKGDYGKVLIIGGSYGKMGSVTLTSRAAMRSGTGLCTVFIPECGYDALQISNPEVMVLTDENSKMITKLPLNFDADVYCFGMGAGTNDATAKAFEEFLKTQNKPIVVDADGINILSKNKSLLEKMPENSVITPHPGELKRLIGEWKDDFDKLEKVKALSKKFKLIVVVKGAHTFIINNEEIYINSSGNPGMATAGSGDVLSGVITSFVGQKYSSLAATILAVYLHGSSGTIASDQLGYESLLAGDIADNIGRAVQELFNRNPEPIKKN
ncbi:NAD(P)H-hydrate dehydratase [Christiangramia sp. ASW11-125]|uniref:NAD(P)H-hydrate dehydratase n=1 Tax=Christiangramia sp. ASW11-125 TaxID=3400701 RepID=UPI003AAEB0BC